MPLEHKTTALEVPHHPVSHQFDRTDVISKPGRDFCVAARTDSGRILSLAVGWGLALQSGRSTHQRDSLAQAKPARRSLTFLLAWFAVTTNLKIGVVHKENPAGRAITELLISLNLEADHAQLFVRPIGREEADANIASTPCGLMISMRSCARTCISFAKCPGLRPCAGPAQNMNIPTSRLYSDTG